MNNYYIVTDAQQRQYQFQQHHQQQNYLNHNQHNNNPMQQQQRVHPSSQSSQSQRHHHPQYSNSSQNPTKESIRLCNPFEESLATSSATSSSNSSVMNSYLERHSSTGYLDISNINGRRFFVLFGVCVCFNNYCFTFIVLLQVVPQCKIFFSMMTIFQWFGKIS